MNSRPSTCNWKWKNQPNNPIANPRLISALLSFNYSNITFVSLCAFVRFIALFALPCGLLKKKSVNPSVFFPAWQKARHLLISSVRASAVQGRDRQQLTHESLWGRPVRWWGKLFVSRCNSFSVDNTIEKKKKEIGKMPKNDEVVQIAQRSTVTADERCGSVSVPVSMTAWIRRTP